MIIVEPIAYVRNERTEPTDDFWGGMQSTIELIDTIDESAFDEIETFSHLEIIFHFHLTDPDKINYASRHPRNNKDWPKVGIFSQRGKERPNRLGLSIVKLIEKKGNRLLVENFDAIDGTPVIDIKPVMSNFLPLEEIKQPFWVDEVSKKYWDKKKKK